MGRLVQIEPSRSEIDEGAALPFSPVDINMKSTAFEIGHLRAFERKSGNATLGTLGRVKRAVGESRPLCLFCDRNEGASRWLVAGRGSGSGG